MSFWPGLLLAASAAMEWTHYGGDAGGTRFSRADQIRKENVSRLQVAWRYHTRDAYTPAEGKGGRPAVLQTTPLYADGTLYLTSALGRVVALDPSTGEERWSFDPKVDPTRGYGDFTNRGVSLYRKGTERRILAVTIDARLFSIDAKNGERQWEVDLRKGLRNAPTGFADYEQTSPPCVIGDVVAVGSAVADNGSAHMASGEVRGFDVRTGKLLWTWDPVPTADAGQTQRAGGANAWSVIAADEKRGLIFVPTGSPSPDYYGGLRKAENFGNSVVALQAKDGKMRWAFQTVHHDLWDYDVASPPLLLRAKGRDAVAVGSKTGHIFILDRDTGKPLFPVEERPVPTSDATGESAAKTQPYPVLPKALSPQKMEVWGIDEESRKWCEKAVSELRNEGIFTPPSTRGTLAYPGNVGGLHWGGMTFDPVQNLLIAPSNNIPAVVRLIPDKEFDQGRKSDRLGMEWAAQKGTGFGMARQILVSPSMTPCNAPPWGTLTAIDVVTGERRWQVPLGDMPGATQGKKWGAINLGGPISTATGLTFIGATFDGYFRAFDSASGKQMWERKLPASARSTPMTYVHGGKQYVVVAAGGHEARFGPMGDEVVAFALQETTAEGSSKRKPSASMNDQR